MKARLIQLLARYVGAGLMFLAGLAAADGTVDPDTAAGIQLSAVEIAGAITGGLALLLDLLIHRLTHGTVIADPKGARR